jgi:methyl-accepting chemotaxis protein
MGFFFAIRLKKIATPPLNCYTEILIWSHPLIFLGCAKMNNWWSQLSLKNKLQIPIQLILMVVLVLAQRTALDKFEAYVLDGAEKQALISADGVLNGLNMLMINGIISQEDQRALYIKKMGSSDKVTELRVIRSKAVQAQFGAGMASEQPLDDLDHAALDTAQVQSKFLNSNNQPRLRVVVPFIAREEFRGTNCLACHQVAAGTVNGAASISLDLSSEFASIHAANYWLWAGQLSLQLVLYFVIGGLIGLVTGSSRELQKSMTAMQADGDLSKRVRVRSADEIGKTAQAFNALVESFQSIVGQVESDADKVSHAAKALTQDTAQMAQASQAQSDAANTAAAAVERSSQTIAQVAEGVSQVASLSNESLERAHRGQHSLDEMMQEIAHVEAAVQEIASSVGAFVTNTKNINSMTLPSKLICWHSMPPLKRRVPVSKDGVLRWWRMRCVSSPKNRRNRPRKLIR